MLLKFKNGEDILLGFQTTAAQTRVLKYRAKFRILAPVKIRGGMGEYLIRFASPALDPTSDILLVGLHGLGEKS